MAREFKEFIRIAGMTHVRMRPYYPQSNGKIERWHKTLKTDALRRSIPSTMQEARRAVKLFVEHYNGVRLHSAIGYIAPNDFLAGRAETIWEDRDAKHPEPRGGASVREPRARRGWRGRGVAESEHGGILPRAMGSTPERR
jgi:putative transposase